jgi:cell wall-associated NlpC family hydrolase
MTALAPAGGVAAALGRVSEIRARFEVPASTGTSALTGGLGAGSSTGSVDFAQLLMSMTGRTALAPALGASTGSDAGQALVDQAMTYLGTPYVWGGTNPEVGLDCSGFVQRVHRDLGIELPRVSRDQARGGTPVASLEEARPGDVLAFGEPVNHVAIYAGDGMMVHSPRRGDVVTYEAIDRPITAIRRYTPNAPVAGANAWAAVGTGSGPTSIDPAAAPYAALFNAAGARHGIDPRVLSAVAKVESGYNPQAVSSAGARGLMQFMPATAAGMGIDPLDPAQAIDGAARYLATQQRDFGSLELALAAYNAGPGAVRRFGGVPPYAQTQAYVQKVMGLLNGGV